MTTKYEMSVPFRENEDVIRIKGDKANLILMRSDDEALRAYLRWLSDEEINMWISQSGNTLSMEQERAYISGALSDEKAHHYCICDKSRDMRIVGNCSIRERGTTATLGIVIGDEHSRNGGLGADVMSMLVRFAFESLGLHRIALSVMEDNIRAIRCYTRVGFKECGRRHEEHWYHNAWHDVIDMEILRGDWETRQTSSH